MRSPAVDADVAEMRAALPSDTVLLVTADHGMIDLPQDGRFDLDQHPGLRDDVVMVAGEARFRHLYTRSGTENDVAARWRRWWGSGRSSAHRTASTTGSARSPRTCAAASATSSWRRWATSPCSPREDFAIEMLMFGFHGSVTEDELRIPLLVAG